MSGCHRSGRGDECRAPAGTALTGRRSAAAYLTLLALGVLDAAGYSVIAPVLPALATRLDAGPLMVGLLVATFPAGMVGGFGFAGLLVRWRGPRPAVLAGLPLAMIGTVGFLLGGAAVTYAAARAVMGVGSGACGWASPSPRCSVGRVRGMSA